MAYIMIGLAGLSQAEFLQRCKDQADWGLVGRYGQIKLAALSTLYRSRRSFCIAYMES